MPFGAANWPAKVISIGPGCKSKALVQLYASGISTKVDATGLTAFADEYEQKCKTVQSQLGRQVRLLNSIICALENCTEDELHVRMRTDSLRQ